MSFVIFPYHLEVWVNILTRNKEHIQSGPIYDGYSEGQSWLVCRVGVSGMWTDIIQNGIRYSFYPSEWTDGRPDKNLL